MKFTVAGILAAAFATASSAAAVPSAAAVGGPLPAFFNLKVTTPTRGTALEPYLGLVWNGDYIRQSLTVGANTRGFPPIVYARNGNAGVKMFDPDFDFTPNMLIVNDSVGHDYPMGWVLGWVMSPGHDDGQFYSGWASSDFVQINGAFAYDARDGKGPRTLWEACPNGVAKNWNIYWNPPASSGCIPVGLEVVAI